MKKNLYQTMEPGAGMLRPEPALCARPPPYCPLAVCKGFDAPPRPVLPRAYNCCGGTPGFKGFPWCDSRHMFTVVPGGRAPLT
uniref:Uncharacterized protein LOC110209053 isoform X3 n=1 Tax=Phascolarctos cinereus TaxID=38626 RepID=A0A6P5KBL3_PHACI|nr:uncharacterized protein LOC110209053 isoform X3 [Phascolarctos cinereus]